MDDACTALPSRRLQDLDHMSEVEASINFTVEVESESRLPPGYAITPWHRQCNLHNRLQETDTYRSPPRFQLPPPPGTQVGRCQNITPPSVISSPEDQKQERAHLWRALLKNGYPVQVIRYHSERQSPQADQPEPPKVRVTIPYIRGLSETIARILSPLDVQTTFRLNTTLQSLLVRPKDRIPDLSKTGVVYRVSCAACPMSYMGQTGRRLQQ